MTKKALHDFIRERELAVLSTVSPDNAAHAALVGIAVTSGLELVFDTLQSSRKYRNLMRNPSVAFVIGWQGEITLQYEGEAEEPRGAELARCKEIYFEKWPDGREREKWPGIAYFKVRPKWIRYSDYNRTPAYVAEIAF